MSRMNRLKQLWLCTLVALVAVSCTTTRPRAEHDEAVVARGHYLLISKQQMRLSVVDSLGEVQLRVPIACGENYGNKEREGDRKTPEGLFWIEEILDAAEWGYDYGDGEGKVIGAYGPYFIRLYTPPHTGIGIHGTRHPESIGTRASADCVRLHNSDLRRLVRYVYVGMPVFITPAYLDE